MPVASKNQLGSLTFPPGLTSLAFLELNGNQLTNFTLPPDLQQLIGFFIADNPLNTFVLPEVDLRIAVWNPRPARGIAQLS